MTVASPGEIRRSVVMKKNTIISPKGEQVWVRCCDETRTLRYLITSNKLRDRYFLYKVNGEKLERIGKARSPSDFDRHIKL